MNVKLPGNEEIADKRDLIFTFHTGSPRTTFEGGETTSDKFST